MSTFEECKKYPGEQRIFEEVEQIGTGAYGIVYKAKDVLSKSDNFVALKKVLIHCGDEGVPITAIREIAMLRLMCSKNHINIVKLFDVCYSAVGPKETLLTLVFEHANHDLTSYIQKARPEGLSNFKIAMLMHQIFSGIDFLHSNRMIHRDIKPQNILVADNDVIKLADFGLAKIYNFGMNLTPVVVTLWYRSPEILLQDSYGTPLDIWSVGCIFAELSNGKALFQGTSEIDLLCKIFNLIGLPDVENWPANVSLPISVFKNGTDNHSFETHLPNLEKLGIDLLRKALAFHPKARITSCKALDHPYFQHFLSNV